MHMSNFFHNSSVKALSLVLLAALVTLPLASCELAKNDLKIDRSSDMEVQDYRDALAQRLPDTKDASKQDDASIPEFKPYMSNAADKLKPMPLVSVSVNQTVPVKDVLYEAAEQADYDLELDPRIQGSIIITVRNKPFDEVIDRICESAGLRYKFSDDSVKIELDTPYHEIYKVNYLSFVRKNTSSISNDVAVVSGEGADTGSKFKAENSSEADYWGELTTNLTQIIESNREAQNLRTKKDPKITAATDNAAPVEPVLLKADGEIAESGAAGDSGDTNVQVSAPNAVLRVEPLPTDEEDANASSSTEDPFAPRFSINKQAGVISVFGNERLQKKVASYLEAIRRATTAQVLIEAKVLEVGLNDEFAAGIDWAATNIFGKQALVSVDSAGDSLAPVFSTPSNPSLGAVAQYISGDLTAAVQALQRYGTVHALASPRLTVLNNQSAVLNVAKNQVYFEISIDTSSDNGTVTTTVDSNIRNVPEGVLINVQPSIDIENRTVSMSVRPTVTRIVDYVNDPGATIAAAQAGLNTLQSPIPVVNVQEFDSVIEVASGQPIVMGGLIQDKTTSTQNAVPVLGEMPLVGGLFRNQLDNVQKTELVVFMKATIVDGNNNISTTDKDMYRGFSQDRRPLDL